MARFSVQGSGSKHGRYGPLIWALGPHFMGILRTVKGTEKVCIR